MTTLTLPAGRKRRLYVDRKRAGRLEAPIIVEDVLTGQRHYAKNVGGWTSKHVMEAFEFKWAGDNVSAPQLWVETEAELELTL